MPVTCTQGCCLLPSVTGVHGLSRTYPPPRPTRVPPRPGSLPNCSHPLLFSTVYFSSHLCHLFPQRDFNPTEHQDSIICFFIALPSTLFLDGTRTGLDCVKHDSRSEV